MAATQLEGFHGLFSHDTVEANGVSFHYVRGGAGRPVVLLHGWPLTWYSWRKIMPALAAQYEVIALDLPGLGGSGAPSAGYEKTAIAADIHALTETLQLGPVALIGHDMGAPVAYAYARLFPTAVTRLALLDVPLTGYGLEEFAHRLHLWHFDFFREPGLAERFIAGHERAFIESFYPDYAPDAINAEARDEYARSYTRPGALAESLAYYRAFPQDEAWTKATAAPKLELPVLAVGGEFAGASAPFASLCQLAHNVTGRVLRDCGHYLAEEKPELLLAELLPFLNENEG